MSYTLYTECALCAVQSPGVRNDGNGDPAERVDEWCREQEWVLLPKLKPAEGERRNRRIRRECWICAECAEEVRVQSA